MSQPHGGSDDLHGNVPDRSGAVLLLVDVINDLDFPQNEGLLKEAIPLGRRIRALKTRCAAAGIPAIYVNDNRGKWRSDMRQVLEWAQRDESPGRDFARYVLPEPEDYIVLKPKHSSFFATPLAILLEYIGAHTVILCGLTTNACVLISAGEVFVRDYRIYVPCDCVAGLTAEAQGKALALMHDNFSANTDASDKLDLNHLLKTPRD